MSQSLHPPGFDPRATGGGLDVISQNVGEAARKVHARDLAAQVVTALFRLVKNATLHSIDNQAMVRQVDDTVQVITEYGARTGHNISLLFAEQSVFVGGQLLRANRGIYEGALELAEILKRVGACEIGIMKDAKQQDFYAFASALAEALRHAKPPRVERPSPKIRLRAMSASALGREIQGQEKLDPNTAVARTYASAIVIMRRFFEQMRKGKYELPQRVKRVAQRLVDLSNGDTPAFLGVTAARNANHDDAGRAVNSAILALSMARQVTTDVVQLVRMAMASLLYDCARPRLAGVIGVPGMVIIPNLSEAQENESPAGTAAVVTALSRVNEPGVMRTVITYEAHWQKRAARLGPVYRGLRPASLQARIIHFARAFNDMLTPAMGEPAPAADEVIARLEQEAVDPADRTVLRLLVGAIGMFPTGTLVELSTGETALVTRTPSHPSRYSQPRVRLVFDANGGAIRTPTEIDLAQKPPRGEQPRHIKRVVATSDDPSTGSLRELAGRVTPGVSHIRPQGSDAPIPIGTIEDAQREVVSRAPTYASQFSQDLIHTVPPPARRAAMTTTPAPNRAGPVVHELPDPDDAPDPYAEEDLLPPELEPLPEEEEVQYQAAAEEPAHEEQQDHGQSTRALDWNEAAKILAEDHSIAQSDQFEPGERTPTGNASDVPPVEAASDEPYQATIGADGLPDVEPTAEGTFGKTPLVHLLVYMLDQRLTGTTIVSEPEGVKHTLYFEDGAVAKIRTGSPIAPLDRVIADQGLLDEATLRGTLMEIVKKKTLHGRHLVQKGLLDREQVLDILRVQVLKKITALFEMPPETHYAYYDGLNLLEEYGGPELTPYEPLAVIMAGVRLRANDRLVDATLERITGRPLALHVDAQMKRFELGKDEQSIVDLLRTRRMTLQEIYDAGVARQERVLRLTLYALAITRHLDLGSAARAPVGAPLAEGEAPPPRPPPAQRRVTVSPIEERSPAPPPAEPTRAPLRSPTHDPASGEQPAERQKTAFGLGFGAPHAEARGRLSSAPPSNPGTPNPSTGLRPLGSTSNANVPSSRRGAEPDHDHFPRPSFSADPAPMRISVMPSAPPSSRRDPPSSRRDVPSSLRSPSSKREAVSARDSIPSPFTPQINEGPVAPPGRQVTQRSATMGGPGAPQTPNDRGRAAPTTPPSSHEIETSSAMAPPGRQTTQRSVTTGGPRAPQPSDPMGGPRAPQTPQDVGAPIAPTMPPQQAAPQRPSPPQRASMPPPSPPQRASMPPPSPPAAPPQAPVRERPRPPLKGESIAAPASPSSPSMAPKPGDPNRRAEIEKKAASIDHEDFFTMLGLKRGSSPAELQKAYFGLAKAWHPDKVPTDLQDLKPQVARVFAKINEAYQTLNDPAKRKDYEGVVAQGGGSSGDDEKIARVVDAAMEFQKAEILLKKNDLAGAEALARRAWQADNEQPDYLALLTWIQALRRGDPPAFKEGATSAHFDDLIRTLDGILQKEPHFEKALFFRGQLLKRVGKYDKAIRDFRLVAEVNSKNIDAVREVRLYEMRKRGGKKGGGEGEGGGGVFGKLFKR